MAAREADVALLRRLGVWPTPEEEQRDGRACDERTVRVVGRPQEPLGRLQWSGWDAIFAAKATVAALECIAPAVHSLRRLMVVTTVWMQDADATAAGAVVEAVAGALAAYPIESLVVFAWGIGSAALRILGAGVEAWLARPYATALQWRVFGNGWEEGIARGLTASEGLRKLLLETYGHVWAAPLLLALQGHASLEEVEINANGGIQGECTSIRLAHMPSLRSCTVHGMGMEGAGGVRLEVEDLPALLHLHLSTCGLVELPRSLFSHPCLQELSVDNNPLQ